MKNTLKKTYPFILFIGLIVCAGFAGRMSLVGPTGVQAVVEANGGLAVNVQDLVTEPVDSLFLQSLSNFTLSADTGASGPLEPSFIYIFEATGGHGISADDEILLLDVIADRSFFAEVISVATNTVTLDRMIDHDFPTTSLCRIVNSDMAVDGSTTPQVFTIRAGVVPTDYTRFILTMRCSSALDNSKFGNLVELDNGLVFRICNGFQKTVFSFDTNGEIQQFCYDTVIVPKVGSGDDYLVARLSFAGQEKHGVALRVEDDSVLQFVVQDNLTGLISLQVAGQGHITQEE